MAKWIYERWDIKWDITNPDYMPTRAPTFLYEIDIVTMQASTIATSPSTEIMGATSEAHMTSFNAGETATVQYAYSLQINPPQFSVTKATLANRRIKDSQLSDIALEEGTVPDDGIHTDGYWYVKIKPAFPTMRILRAGQWVEVETGFVLKDGVWKPIEEIYKLQDGQWMQA